MIHTHRYTAPVETPVQGKLLEIETTGLRPERGTVTVISVAETKENCLHTTQWIAASKDDEGALLTRALPVLADAALTVFHAPFLLPFLAYRAENAGLSFAPGPVTDLRAHLLALRPFFPLERTSRNAIAQTLGLELPTEPNGEDVARLTRRLYKKYDRTIADRIACHNLLHIQALYGMTVFADRWNAYLTRTLPSFQRPVRLKAVQLRHDFLTAEFVVRDENPAFLTTDHCELTIQPQRALLRVEVKQGMITETMPCLFTEIFDLPALKDRTGFSVPDGVLLLQVEDRFLPEALFDLLHAVFP